MASPAATGATRRRLAPADAFDPDDVVGTGRREPAQHVEPAGGEARDPLAHTRFRVVASLALAVASRSRRRASTVAELGVVRDVRPSRRVRR